MIGLPVRLRKGRDFLVRSLTQTSGQDLHRSVMVSHQNKVVSGIILRFFRRLNRDASGLSAVEWSPFRTIQSRLIRLMVGPLSSNVFCSKKQAFSHVWAHGEILHPFERERQHNFDAQGGPPSAIFCRTKLGGDRRRATPQPS